MEKVCTKCGILKKLDEYHLVSSKSEKRRSFCKGCHSTYTKKYYSDNKDHMLAQGKIWCENNKDKRKESRLRRYKENPQRHKEHHLKWLEKNPNYKKDYKEKNKEYVLIKNKEYRDSKKEYINEYHRKYYKENCDRVNQRIKKYRKETNYIKLRKKRDPLFRIKTNVRNLIRQSITERGYKKNSKSFQILGCTFEYLKEYIESKWETWMSWENYGLYNGDENYGWDLDHILPLSSAITEEDILKLNHYKNLQPLCSYKNRVLKRDLVDWEIRTHQR